ncbi:hypothetical protein ACFLRF_05800 [Candidatus Altiarchaeota archaeon]
MIQAEGKLRKRIALTKDALLQKIFEKQKPVLDQKIDDMLKQAPKVNHIMVKYLGMGRNIGKRIGGLLGVGRSLFGMFR